MIIVIFDILKSSVLNIWPSLVILTITLVSVRIAHLRTHNDRICFYKEFWTLVAAVYLLLLYELVTRVDVNYVSGMNLVPFAEILRHDIHSTAFYLNVFGNIALFIPFGYIIAVYINPKKIWTNAIIAAIVSTTIEFVQLRIGRSFDIDDIILNTVGCIIGFLIYVALKAISKHLPHFLRSDWFNNLICIIITILLVLYTLNIMGIQI